ncbi:Hypothetical_protein [Hexamita inflata]|uniref:Hypothetical_protein n=1 Tax=Hexamita inflata TaxID=28002 RepID=A0AA86P1H1_9EUKA|nr:Hypothetical protein HINF_LOCUS7329 [Hexamita inflata]CAI9929896.1 Hypothetical protein HINF_LOCUS17541 [Hexamita inflata]
MTVQSSWQYLGVTYVWSRVQFQVCATFQPKLGKPKKKRLKTAVRPKQLPRVVPRKTAYLKPRKPRILGQLIQNKQLMNLFMIFARFQVEYQIIKDASGVGPSNHLKLKQATYQKALEGNKVVKCQSLEILIQQDTIINIIAVIKLHSVVTNIKSEICQQVKLQL